MSENITVTGLVATTPRHLVTSEGVQITSFRLASVERRFDGESASWVDGATNWFTVTAFRDLAVNAVGSVVKGQRIIVLGRLSVRDWESGDRSGTTVEAETLGHDLRWGEATFTKANRVVPLTAAVEGGESSRTIRFRDTLDADGDTIRTVRSRA